MKVWHAFSPAEEPVLHALTLAGVGLYTGAAIASIACSEPVAVVDANVMRCTCLQLKPFCSSLLPGS